MQLLGLNFIGKKFSGNGKEIFNAVNPRLNKKMEPDFHEATAEEIDNAVRLTEEAFKDYRNKSGKDKANFLNTIADEIIELGDELIKRCCDETALPEARITGERSRAVNQLRLFAELLRDGSWVEARIDTADQQRQPLPKPDIRSMKKALGPVGIFGASNFPLAFSVAGGDTASALAAGCTIVVKAHPAHPGTCELIGNAIKAAVEKSDMPNGTFSMVHGISTEVGMAIVKHPLIKAIGFTGSFRGGKAIYDAAVQRPEPIPVFAEMGSSNPVFILPGAMKSRKKEIASGLAASVTLGVGQFCTNPGLVFYENLSGIKEFQKSLAENFNSITADSMLTSGINNAYKTSIENMKKRKDIQILAEGKSQNAANEGAAYLMQTNSEDFLKDEQLEKEIFGPSTLNVKVNNKSELLKIAEKLNGHLTVTLHATDEDLKNYSELISVLERKAGRLIINGFPTGVEVCHSIVHGGPFPATTDSHITSVGTLAINRFSRPVCYQNFPDEFLPDELKNRNPLQIWRLVNGKMGNGEIR
jgi:NADP-dependent aldehyde dehydrogenase